MHWLYVFFVTYSEVTAGLSYIFQLAAITFYFVYAATVVLSRLCGFLIEDNFV
jgi:hypothetical protein